MSGEFFEASKLVQDSLNRGATLEDIVKEHDLKGHSRFAMYEGELSVTSVADALSDKWIGVS